MKIVSLKAENVKRLKAVEIHPDGSLVVVGGRNAQGKTSVLDSITMALGGAAAFCERPLRDGAEHGEIVVDLGDLVVRRSFDAKGGTKLVVRGKDGNTKTSPQTLLDALAGRMSFDPLTFSRMDRKKQLETLKELVGLDLSDLEARHRTLFEERTTVGRDGQAVKARLEAMPHHPDVPAEELSVLDLSAELEAALDNNRKRASAIERSARASAQAITLRTDATALAAGSIVTNEIQNAAKALAQNDRETALAKAEIERLEDALAMVKAKHEDLVKSRAYLDNEVDRVRAKAVAEKNEAALAAAKEHSEAEALVAALPEIPAQPIRDRIANIETINRKVRENRNHADQQRTIDKARIRWDELTLALEELDKQKKARLAAAKFPVAGLSFDESGVLFNGVPFAQASSAEQLRVSVAMGLALNPTLRVVLIRDGSLLDDDGLRLVAEMAAEKDAQVWVERVSDDGEGCSVVIEDGMVSEQAEAVTP